jgi:manganese/iron transport system ATP-binding protein
MIGAMGHGHPPNNLPIRAVALSASYDGTTALEQLNFTIEPGHRVAVVGPNGAGKSTLFRVIAGVLQPSHGSIEIHGHQAGQHLCVGYVPEQSQVNLDFPVSVSDVVMMGRVREIGLLRRPKPADWQIVDRALDSVRLRDRRSRHFGDLSAGQRQRVFLAQAVVQGAQIILLDEPFSGLDIPSQEALLTILDDLRRDSISVLVATHDLNFAQSHFDRVMLLNRQLIAYGEPAAVLTPENLRQAYGGHLHVVTDGQHTTLLADTHHEGH